MKLLHPFLRAALLAACLTLAFLVAPSVRAAGETNAVLLTAEGTIEVLKVGATDWTPAQANQSLNSGDRLRSGRNSRATIRLSNNSVLRVSALTTLEIQPPEKPGQSSALNLQAGSVYFFNRERPMTTQFRTPSASGAIRGTEFDLTVAEDGRMLLTLVQGEVDLVNEAGEVKVSSGEQAVAEKGKAPQKSPSVDAINVIQWSLYYPGVLDVDELELEGELKEALAGAMESYRAGDLLRAVSRYPFERPPKSDFDRVFQAALKIVVGRVDYAEEVLKEVPAGSKAQAMADAIRKVIAAVKHQQAPTAGAPSLATEWIAESYYQQSRGNLEAALAAATSAMNKSPRCGYAAARVAELEFGFGRVPQAMDALDKALAVSPKNAEAVALKGFLFTAKNRMVEAQKQFDDAIALDGSLGNAWLGRGLVKIRRGSMEEGRKDLQVAATIEPNRALFRSYLAKAHSQGLPFRYSWDQAIADKELNQAKRIDPNDPTSWLYSALLNQQRGRINEALSDLETSQKLNDNRSIFRSRLLLDQDSAVRSANLAAIYRDAGMTDVGVREAAKAVNADYANYSAHLFLADNYDSIRDPKKLNNRYETPWLSEYLLANLLSPVGAGTLSQNISQQEYSKLFEADRLGVLAKADLFSSGDWMVNGSQFGNLKDFGYALDYYRRFDRGQRPNNFVRDTSFSAKVKYQLTPQDTLFIMGEHNSLKSGDVTQYYNQAVASATMRQEEVQDNVFLGYRHNWNPEHNTLLFFGRVADSYEFSDPNAVLQQYRTNNAWVDRIRDHAFNARVNSDVEAYNFEAQHIWQTARNTLVAGGRYQQASTENTQNLFRVADPFKTPIAAPAVNEDINRISVYAYDTFKILDNLALSAGLTYDRLEYPQNIITLPYTPGTFEKERFTPKLGLEWEPFTDTDYGSMRLRAAYTRSMGGVFFDQSYRLEPTQIAGFNQAFRSLIPESVVSTVPGTEFETYGLGLDHKFPTRTYFGVEAEKLKSNADRMKGVLGSSTPPFNVLMIPDLSAGSMQALDYKEQVISSYVSQLLSDEWSVGARYKLTQSEMVSLFPRVLPTAAGASAVNQDLESVLHMISLYANYNLPCGFFSSLEGVYAAQSNKGFMPDEPGDNFWQCNVYAGYRFPRRHAEVRLGLLNLTDQDYQIEPLTLYLELPRERTIAVSVKISF